MEACTKCFRERPAVIADPTCVVGGYCAWAEKPHHCTIPQHLNNAPGYGAAIMDCLEQEGGFFYASNGEYGNHVSFCPFCGMKAKAEPKAPESV
jgi:hypothetical protein